LRRAALLSSEDEEWKEEDPNFPKGPWWFTDDPARGIGFRLFRSYQPLYDKAIENFWKANAEEVVDDVEARLLGGRGVVGQVDKSLPEAIKKSQ